jgi:DNA segregation ATPase FtsK/SpoIIIE-like protein
MFLLLLGTLLLPQKASPQPTVSLQVFYDDLSPYGNWVNNPDYGYVWIPQVAQGFTPYNTNGHWVYTDMGWTWASDYSWGWAPFHYGRWYNDSYYGWVWVPDTEWGPGWVSWRHSDAYYGWAPIGPGISIEIAYSSGYSLPNNQWTFVRNRDFGRRNITNYYVNNSNNVTIINNTTIINNVQRDTRRNVRYNAGPDRKEVQTRSGTMVAQIPIKDREKPGQNAAKNELQLYRPQVERNNSQGNKPVPTKVVALKEVKPEAQRSKAGNPKVFPEQNNQRNGQKVPQAQSNQPVKPALQNQPKKAPQPLPSRGNVPSKQAPTKNQPQNNKPQAAPVTPQRNNQQTAVQQAQQQQNNQKAQQQQVQQQRNNQQVKQQQVQQQQNNQKAQQQQVQQQRNNQQNKQQQVQQQQNNKQVQQQQVQQQRNNQQAQQQQVQQQRNNQQAKQQQGQQQQINKQARQPQGQPNANDPSKR